MLQSFFLFPDQPAKTPAFLFRHNKTLFLQTLPKASCRTLSGNRGLEAVQYPQDRNPPPTQARAAIWLFQWRPGQYLRHKCNFELLRASVRILFSAGLTDNPELFAKISGASRSY